MAWSTRARQLAVALLLVALLPLAGFCLMVATIAGPGGVPEGLASLVAAPALPAGIG